MNRRKFALSWGRKLFFGISWPLSMLLGLVYLRSFIVPESTEDYFYFISTFVGHFGILNIVAYFLLYVPFVALSPSYYVPRIWAVLLIVLINSVILLDAIAFSSFHLHLYSFITPLLIKEGIHHLLGSNVVTGLLGGGALVLAVMIWIRGDQTWRYMQRRFSNPVSNWYLLLIVFSFIFGKILFYNGKVSPQLAAVFPLNMIFKDKMNGEFSDNRRFFYSGRDLECKAGKNPNLVMIILEQWDAKNLNSEDMPRTFHIQEHSLNFRSHLSVANDTTSSKFALMYSLPSTYFPLWEKKKPALIQELESRNYEINEFHSIDGFNQWLANRSGDEEKPYFLRIYLSGPPSATDPIIDNMFLALETHDLLTESHVVLTGLSSSNESGLVPLMLIGPNQKKGEVTHITSSYDIIPSLMSELWGCRKVFSKASVGEPLNKEGREWIIVTTRDGFKVMDLKNESILRIQNGELILAGKNPQPELIFSALRQLTKFNRPL